MPKLEKIQSQLDSVAAELLAARKLTEGLENIDEEGAALVRDGLLTVEQFERDKRLVATHMQQLRKLELLFQQTDRKLQKAKSKFTLEA
jgi:hypothetical protein